MATCIAAYGADITIRNAVGLKPVTVENFVGAKKMEDLYPKATVTDKGITAEADWVSRALLGVSIASEVMAHKIAYDEYRLATREANLARDSWDRFRRTYAPVEKRIAAYLKIQWPIKEGRYLLDKLYEKYATDSWRQADAQFRRFRICVPQYHDRRNNVVKSILDADVSSLANKLIESRKLDRWAAWFNRRSSFLNIGQDIMANSARYISQGMDMMSANRQFFSELSQGTGYVAGYRNMNNILEARRNQGTATEHGTGQLGRMGVQARVGDGAFGTMIPAGGVARGDATATQAIPNVQGAFGMTAGYQGLELSINDRAGLEISVPPGGSFNGR